MNIPFANRISSLPPYLFAGIDKVKNKLVEEGIDVISLGIGDPDMPTPEFIVNALIEATQRSVNHRYPSYLGMLDFRKAVAEWYERRFNVMLNPETEVIVLAGSKEGIAHVPLAFVQEGDYVIVCPPNYPVYG
ncbi:MAG: aminotransferase class I/II-fold pyridoxal phosphate-dependent enzyme, partial [Desulfovibrionaceae bacterium]|nr:aminotransferase class I/II-fold pyridoxal phosphate-dependent enzyme [Desulfovibrionaceae bacterium]